MNPPQKPKWWDEFMAFAINVLMTFIKHRGRI